MTLVVFILLKTLYLIFVQRRSSTPSKHFAPHWIGGLSLPCLDLQAWNLIHPKTHREAQARFRDPAAGGSVGSEISKMGKQRCRSPRIVVDEIRYFVKVISPRKVSFRRVIASVLAARGSRLHVLANQRGSFDSRLTIARRDSARTRSWGRGVTLIVVTSTLVASSVTPFLFTLL